MSLQATGLSLDNGHTAHRSVPSRSTITKERAASIARSILKYTTLTNLAMDQVVLQLMQQLPILPMNEWSSFCQHRYQMHKLNRTYQASPTGSVSRSGTVPRIQVSASQMKPQQPSHSSLSQSPSRNTAEHKQHKVNYDAERPLTRADYATQVPYQKSLETTHGSTGPGLNQAPDSSSGTSGQVVEGPESFAEAQSSVTDVTHLQSLADKGRPAKVARVSPSETLHPKQYQVKPLGDTAHRSHSEFTKSTGEAVPHINISTTAARRPDDQRTRALPGTEMFAKTQRLDAPDNATPPSMPLSLAPISQIVTQGHSLSQNLPVISNHPFSIGQTNRIAVSKAVNKSSIRKSVSREKHESILARAVLLAAGKVPEARLNQRLEVYRHILSKDIRNTQFDVYDPPISGQTVKRNAIVPNRYISHALREGRHSPAQNEDSTQLIQDTNVAKSNVMSVTPSQSHINNFVHTPPYSNGAYNSENSPSYANVMPTHLTAQLPLKSTFSKAISQVARQRIEEHNRAVAYQVPSHMSATNSAGDTNTHIGVQESRKHSQARTSINMQHGLLTTAHKSLYPTITSETDSTSASLQDPPQLHRPQLGFFTTPNETSTHISQKSSQPISSQSPQVAREAALNALPVVDTIRPESAVTTPDKPKTTPRSVNQRNPNSPSIKGSSRDSYPVTAGKANKATADTAIVARYPGISETDKSVPTKALASERSRSVTSSISEFVVEVPTFEKRLGLYYDSNELSTLNKIEADRDEQLISLDPDAPSFNAIQTSIEPEIVENDDGFGFPVYQCGFWQCTARLHTFDNLVRHCDKVHGHKDNSGTFVCHWGDCHSRKIFFTDIARWQAHLDEEHQQGIKYVCRVTNCKEAFPYEDDLALHMQTMHDSRVPRYDHSAKRPGSTGNNVPHKRKRQQLLSDYTIHDIETISIDSDVPQLVTLESQDELNLLVGNDSLITPASAPTVSQNEGKASMEALAEYDTSMPGPQAAHSNGQLQNKLERHIGWNETWDIVSDLQVGVRGSPQVAIEVVMRTVPLIGREEPKREVTKAVFPVVDLGPTVMRDPIAFAISEGVSERETWFSIEDASQ